MAICKQIKETHQLSFQSLNDCKVKGIKTWVFSLKSLDLRYSGGGGGNDTHLQKHLQEILTSSQNIYFMYLAVKAFFFFSKATLVAFSIKN